MILIVDCGSQKISDILSCVENSGKSGKIVPLKNIENIEGSWDAVIISGAPILLSQITETSSYVKQAHFLLDLNIPILGICFGHQIIGMAFGADVFMGDEDRADQTITSVKKDVIHKDLNDVFEMQQDHCEQITLPAGFDLLASSKISKVEVMKHQRLPVYGCQFHPEVSGENGQQFIQNFLSI